MNHTDFEKQLQQALHRLPVTADPAHLARTQLLAGQAAARRQSRCRLSYRRFLVEQLKFTAWKIWGGQGLLLLLLWGLLSRDWGEYFWAYPQAMVRLLFCASVLIAMTALPLLYRAARWKMQEVEAASYFSAGQILLAKLAVIGLGDLALLAGTCLAAVVKTSLQAGNVSFYLCVPFLLVSSCGLFLLGHVSSQHFLVGSLGLCSLLLTLGMTVPGRYVAFFQQSFTGGWLGVCGLLLVFCVYQFHYLLYRSPYTELQVGG